MEVFCFDYKLPTYYIIIRDKHEIILMLFIKYALTYKKKEIPILKKRYGALIIGAAVTVSSFGFTIYGTIHARNMTTKEYDVSIEKHVDGLDGLNVKTIISEAAI